MLTFITNPTFLFSFSVFKSQPTLPPSAAQARQLQIKSENIFKILASILRKPSFLLILLSYGWNVGAFNAVATLLNQIVLINYPVS